MHSTPTEHLGVLESVKAAADLCSPVGGTVVEINTNLEETPDIINKDPYELGKSCFVEEKNRVTTPLDMDMS